MARTARVFIDGEAGTTGLEIRDRLSARDDLELLAIDPARRKDREARRECLNGADIVILCLPDAAAREALSLIENPATRVLDASTAHRIADGWTYGFAEMASGQRNEIARGHRIANPGCYPTGFIALTRPLIEAGIVPADWPLSVHAVSGYSGGGRTMIAEFEADRASDRPAARPRAYALDLAHKHLPEMRRHAGLTHAPVFAPSVGRFYRGMMVEVPLSLWALPGRPSAADVRIALEATYKGEALVKVAKAAESAALTSLDAEALAGTDSMVLHLFAGDGVARLVAVLDNLGKGAAGAAVQNVNLMLGADETAGLKPFASGVRIDRT